MFSIGFKQDPFYKPHSVIFKCQYTKNQDIFNMFQGKRKSIDSKLVRTHNVGIIRQSVFF